MYIYVCIYMEITTKYERGLAVRLGGLAALSSRNILFNRILTRPCLLLEYYSYLFHACQIIRSGPMLQVFASRAAPLAETGGDPGIRNLIALCQSRRQTSGQQGEDGGSTD